MGEKRMLPQDMFAEQALMAYMYRGHLTDGRIKEMLCRANLKLKKGMRTADIQLAIGRGFRNTFGRNDAAIEQIAEEVDRVCTIRNWHAAVAKYATQKKGDTL